MPEVNVADSDILFAVITDPPQPPAGSLRLYTKTVSGSEHLVSENGSGQIVDYTGAAIAFTGWTNTRSAKTTGYTLLNSDKGTTIALGGTAFYTLTVNAANTYDANFLCVLVNEDTTRGKLIVISGYAPSFFVLYPQQSLILYASGGAWYTIGRDRWRVPGATLQMYTDFTNGSDGNDGLAAGTGNAKKTVQGALDTCINDFDFCGWTGIAAEPTTNTRVAINMAASTTDTQGVHFSAHALVGAQG